MVNHTARLVYKTHGKETVRLLQASVRDGRTTGGSNTSLGTTIIQSSATHACIAQQFPDPDDVPVYAALFCGDDTVIIECETNRIDTVAIESCMKAMGFKSKVRSGRGTNTVYCSSLFWKCHTGAGKPAAYLGPLPFRQLAKFSWCVSPVMQWERKPMARAKALSLWTIGRHVPLLSGFLARVLELTGGMPGPKPESKEVSDHLARLRAHTYRPYVGTDVRVSPAGINQFLERYQMDMATFRQLEAALTKWRWGEYLNEPEIARCLEIDLDVMSGSQDRKSVV